MLDLRFLEEGKAIRDPIWGYIHIPPDFLPIVDAEEFQRLRDISQLGHVLLVYPGSRHSRFEHALGVFHIAGHFLKQLLKTQPPPNIDIDDVRVLLAASLLHDIGHYPFSHLLEEMQMFFINHETRGRYIIEDPSTEIHAALLKVGIDPQRVANVIDYQQRTIPDRDTRLAHILSGTLDPDKIDYLLRDARYCGVPFGESVNRDRLLSSITYHHATQRPAITYKGVSAAEALIFTSYLMYRNVYWHHAVRSANAMFKRGIQDLLAHPNCALTENDFDRATESDLLHRLEKEHTELGISYRTSLIGRLKRRKLFKVARIFFPHEYAHNLINLFRRLYDAPDQRRKLEMAFCAHLSSKLNLNLCGNEILLDILQFDKSPEVDLKVFFDAHIPLEKSEPLSFDDPEVSLLKNYLIDNFEAQAKVVRIFCDTIPNLRQAVRDEACAFLKNWATVRA